MAADLAAEVVTLARLGRRQSRQPRRHRRAGATPGTWPCWCAPTVQALTRRDALHDAGVPAVTNGSGSVFSTEPAAEWLRLLDALERPTARDRAASAALTDFIGWSAERVATAVGPPSGRTCTGCCTDGRRILRHRGVAALFEHVSATRHLPGPRARPDFG